MTTQSPHPKSKTLDPGSKAPAFDLPSTLNRKLSLADSAGSPLVLVFYPADFTPVCSDELALYNELIPEFDIYKAKVWGLSVDSVWCNQAFARDRRLKIPLLSDFHPKAEVCRRYQVYRDEDGFAERALYVLDNEGTVFWSYASPVDVNPGADGVLDALERLGGQASRENDFVQQEVQP